MLRMIRSSFVLILQLLLLIPFSSIVLAHPGHAHDEEATESAQIQDIQYELPYPGMLPDNPLYFLKTMRDAVVKFLISDSLKEAEFNILTANKRAYAALLLSEKEKPDFELVIETISKSNNYLHEATVSLGKAKDEDKDFLPMLDNAGKSVKKHRQVFSRQIMPNTPENMKKAIETEIRRLDTIEKSVNNLASK